MPRINYEVLKAKEIVKMAKQAQEEMSNEELIEFETKRLYHIVLSLFELSINSNKDRFQDEYSIVIGMRKYEDNNKIILKAPKVGIFTFKTDLTDFTSMAQVIDDVSDMIWPLENFLVIIKTKTDIIRNIEVRLRIFEYYD